MRAYVNKYHDEHQVFWVLSLEVPVVGKLKHTFHEDTGLKGNGNIPDNFSIDQPLIQPFSLFITQEYFWSKAKPFKNARSKRIDENISWRDYFLKELPPRLECEVNHNRLFSATKYIGWRGMRTVNSDYRRSVVCQNQSCKRTRCQASELGRK